MVITCVAVHPFELVYVMVVFPVFTPVTNPALETVALAGVPETHALFAAAVPLPERSVVAPEQRLLLPEMVGFGLTTTVCCAVVAHCPADGVNV
jgi:hypothetical protein